MLGHRGLFLGGGLSCSLNLGADFGQLRGILSKTLQLGQPCPSLLGHAMGKIESNLIDNFVGLASFAGDGNFMVADGVSDLDSRGFGSGRGQLRGEGEGGWHRYPGPESPNPSEPSPRASERFTK